MSTDDQDNRQVDIPSIYLNCSLGSLSLLGLDVNVVAHICTASTAQERETGNHWEEGVGGVLRVLTLGIPDDPASIAHAVTHKA